MGPGTGNWGMMEAEDETVFQALIAHAEEWLRTKGMERALGPFSLSVWDEPGLQVSGFGHPPTVMMGHNSPAYRGWVEAAEIGRASWRARGWQDVENSVFAESLQKKKNMNN